MADLGIQEKKFSVRLAQSKIWTHMLVTFLKKTKHIVDFRQATESEDKDDLIDYWFKYPGSDEYVPIAFKLRVDPAKRDIPVVRNQPFWGVDGERTVVGRDFRCLTEKNIQQYYVAVKNANGEFSEIYRISKNKLSSLVLEIDNNWTNVPQELRNSFISAPQLTNERNNAMLINKVFKGKGAQKIWSVDQGEIWWQKNPSEKFSKVNFYIPETFKEESFLVSKAVYQRMVKSYIKFTGEQ